MTGPPRVVDVAAAVMIRPDGRFLLAQRPPGKVYEGYWEFPGGKAEPGEPLATALVRELHEELGIEATRAYPWIVEEYVYPHAHVRLHFFRVLEWRGEPHPREQQQFSWAAVGDLGVAPLLPANGPVLRALGLPAVLAITNASELGIAAALERVERCARARRAAGDGAGEADGPGATARSSAPRLSLDADARVREWW